MPRRARCPCGRDIAGATIAERDIGGGELASKAMIKIKPKYSAVAAAIDVAAEVQVAPAEPAVDGNAAQAAPSRVSTVESGPEDWSAASQSASEALEAGRLDDAVRQAERALSLDPTDAAAWFVLGVARNNLGERDAAIAALNEACERNPDNLAFRAMHLSVEARAEKGWQDAFRRLARMQADHPDSEFIRDLLALVYMGHALRNWTEVEADGGGGALVKGGRKAARLIAGGDIPPGTYPTTAMDVANASLCVERARALGSKEPNVLAGMPGLEGALEGARARHYTATWGETGVAAIYAIAGTPALLSSPGTGLLMVASGVAMLMAGFEPQYRTNRTALSRRGMTVGDMAAAAAQSHRYGGIVYLVLLIAGLPFIAAFKLYKNWGEGWLAHPEILDLTTPTPVTPDTVADLPPLEASPPADEAVEAPDAPRQRDALSEPATPTMPAAVVDLPPLGAAPRVDGAVKAADAPRHQAVPSGPSNAAETVSAANDEAQAAPLVFAPAPTTRQAAVRRSGGGIDRRFAGQPMVVWLGFGGAALAIVLGALWFVARPKPGQASLVAPAASASAMPVLPPRAAPLAQAPAAPSATSAVTLSGVPEVLDTGDLSISGTTAHLSGIAGEGGIPARQMAAFIHEQGGRVACELVKDGAYVCRTPQGYDVAAAALVNGAARATADAPADYRDLQGKAQAERKGIWQ
jgi:hypothetical protein